MLRIKQALNVQNLLQSQATVENRLFQGPTERKQSHQALYTLKRAEYATDTANIIKPRA